MKNQHTRFLFFTGKGGVGKTSLACATAVQLADEGKKVLLISTDPASNLEDVLGCPVGSTISQHPNLPNLSSININPHTAADEYRARVVAPLQGSLSAEAIGKITEGLSGACTTEIASFDEFSRFLTAEGEQESYDHIIFDTAPTGHTLRLLELPAAWDEFLENNPNGASCIGPSSALKSSKARYKKVMQLLQDGTHTTYYLVSRPERYALKEAERTSLELNELGLVNQKLLLNAVFAAIDPTDALAKQIESKAKTELEAMPAALKQLERTDFPLLPYNVLGLERLRSLLDQDLQEKIIARDAGGKMMEHQLHQNLLQLVDGIEQNQQHGLIMTMGKGGVGKTLTAVVIAILLAKRGHKVLLTTTDPAAHTQNFLNQLPELPASLEVQRIDPKIETQRYIDKIVAQKGKHLDEKGKNLLLEDLKSPCSEEVAVFHAFSKAIQQSKRQFVVIDTAPTGHTLLLLDTTGSYHKEVLKNTTLNPEKIMTPLMYLQDKTLSKIILVALPEITPVHEAEALQKDLGRAGIIPYSWVINQSLSARDQLTDPILLSKAIAEQSVIRKVDTTLAQRTYVIPYLADEKILPALLNSFEKEHSAVN